MSGFFFSKTPGNNKSSDNAKGASFPVEAAVRDADADWRYTHRRSLRIRESRSGMPIGRNPADGRSPEHPADAERRERD
jgi:hypothetical protein